MCRNKKKAWVLPILAAALCWQACAVPDKLMADTGSNGQKEIDKEEYLNVDALSGQTAGRQYTVYTLTKETYEEEVLEQKLEREYANSVTVYAELGDNLYRLTEYTANYMDYVEKGDVLAVFHVTSDEVAIEEVERKLQRLEEQYRQETLEREKELREQEKAREKLIQEMKKQDLGEDCYEVKAFDMRAAQGELTWEYERQKMEQEIEDTQKHIEKLTGDGSILQIKAPADGYVIYDYRYSIGSNWRGFNVYICNILDKDAVYFKVERQGDLFGYGMDMTLDTVVGEVPGRVISAGDMALYGNLNTGTATFLVDFGEELPDELQKNVQNATMRGSMKTVENVLLVPRQAVVEENGEYFVTVLKEDGSLLKTEFIPGGSNSDCYWVMDGLEEGMQIIYK